MSTRQLYFRRRTRAPQKIADFSGVGDFIDLHAAHLQAYETGDAVGKAQSLFDARAAACVSAGVAVDGWTVEPGGTGPVRVWAAVAWTPDGPRDPGIPFWSRDLLKVEWTDDDSVVSLHLLMPKCLPAMAYLDFFPDQYRVGEPRTRRTRGRGRVHQRRQHHPPLHPLRHPRVPLPCRPATSPRPLLPMDRQGERKDSHPTTHRNRSRPLPRMDS